MIATDWPQDGLSRSADLPIFRTAGLWPAHDHDAGQRPAVRKSMSRTWRSAAR